MELSSVRIRGFRSIKDQRIGFANRCQILVGVNESGKTNILRALRLLDVENKPTARDRRHPLESEPTTLLKEVDFEFAWTEAERQTFAAELGKHFLVKEPATTLLCGPAGAEKTVAQYIGAFTIPLVWANLDSLTRGIGNYSLLTAPIGAGWFARPDELTGLTVELDGKSFPVERFKFIYQPDFPSIPTESLRPLKPIDLSKATSTEMRTLLEPQIPKCVFWTYKEEYLLPSSVPLTAFADNPASCIPLKQMFRLAEIVDVKKEIDGHRALGTNALRNLLERVAKRATKHIRQVWKEYKNIEIKLEVNGESIDSSVVDHFNRYDFADRSDGFKRFVSFLLVLSAQARTQELSNTLILIDEAEIGIHPSGVKYLRDELIKVAETNFVVVSTHSIFMVDKSKIDRHLIVKKTNETTEVVPVNDTNIFEEEVVYNALNYSVFENLKPFNLVFEGWRDKRLYEVAITKDVPIGDGLLGRLRDVGRCHLQGVNDAGRVVPMLELADRKYIVVTDSDEAALKAQKRFHGTGPWMTYADLQAPIKTFLTSEDFVSAAAFKASIAARAKRHGTEALVLDDEKGRRPRVGLIRAWLQGSCGLEGDELKEALDQIKEDVFTGLKRSQVLPEYFPALERLADGISVE